jgi:hypothetical protein
VTAKDNSAAKLGWRFGIGITILIGAYAAWSFIPAVVASDLSPGVKSALAAILGATPFISKFVAVALMGRPAYEFFKRNVLKSLRLASDRPRA